MITEGLCSLSAIAPKLLRAKDQEIQLQNDTADLENAITSTVRDSATAFEPTRSQEGIRPSVEKSIDTEPAEKNEAQTRPLDGEGEDTIQRGHKDPEQHLPRAVTRITFDPSADQRPRNDTALYIPGPRERDRGDPLVELSGNASKEGAFYLQILQASKHVTDRHKHKIQTKSQRRSGPDCGGGGPMDHASPSHRHAQ